MLWRRVPVQLRGGQPLARCGCAALPTRRLSSSVLGSAAASDPIFALSTAPGVAAIAVFRLTGPDLEEAVTRLLRHPAATLGQPDERALPRPRMAAVRHIVHPVSGQLLDEGLALWFPGPSSFTGEDMLELHVHGSRAVCSLMHDALAAVGGGMRQAHAGEFSMRAFENGKIDLTQAEGLSDLLAAETTVQHKQAVAQALGSEGGTLRTLYDGWREQISRHLARVEAAIDFVDEEIDCARVLAESIPAIEALRGAIASHASHGLRGERGRLGLRVTLAGAPNAGKSALLNSMVGHSAAIVNETAGTTRDVVEVAAALGDPSTGAGGALPVLLSDTAGVRVVAEAVEAEGVRRATARWAESDLRLLVIDAAALAPALAAAVATANVSSTAANDAVDTQGVELGPMVAELLDSARPQHDPLLLSGTKNAPWDIGIVLNKCDLWEDHKRAGADAAALSCALSGLFPGLTNASGGGTAPVWCVSCETGEGLDALTAAIASNAREMLSARQYVEGGGSEGGAGHLGGSGAGSSVEGEAAIPTRARHRVQLDAAIGALDGFLESSAAGADLELAAEELRIAVRCMGRLTGAVSVEDLLGVIFKEFCVGK